MSEKDRKGPYGRPAPRQDAPRRQDRPRPPQGERQYRRPAPKPEGGERRFGRPAPRPADGERKFGRPAPRPEGGERKPFGQRPAGPRPAEGERKFGRPAPRPAEGERKFGRPAPRPEGGERKFGRPAPKPAEGERKPFGRPAPRPSDSERKPFGQRPGGDRPAFGRPAGPRPAFNKPGSGSPRPLTDPKPARPAPGMSSDARKSAWQVLNRVLLESGFASLSLDEHFSTVYLSPRDKRLCTHIVYLTLENVNRLDFALDRLLEDPSRLDKRLRNLLRLSAAQILLLDRVPDSAAVNEAVKLTREAGMEELTGLVNGVLRNLIRSIDEIPWPKPEDGLSFYTIMHSLPEWYVSQVLADYGPETGHQILIYQRPRHGITIRPNLNRVSEAQFQQILDKKTWTHEKGIMPQAWQVYGAADIARDIDFLEGSFSIQGEGSMVAAEAAYLKLGAQVLDTCAAPGGKAAYLAEKMQGTGRIHAWDVHAHRVDLIQALAERLRFYNIRPALRDALVYREQLETSMDVVLIDAPCTGSGVMIDKPDLKARLQQENLTSLVQTQRQMLDTCWRYVRPGGLLVYATCSLLPDENERQVAAFLSEHPAFQMDPLPDSIPEQLRQQTGEHGLQLLPHRDGTEGFFVARMRRMG